MIKALAQLTCFAAFLAIGYCFGGTQLYYACQDRMVEQQWDYLQRNRPQ